MGKIPRYFTCGDLHGQLGLWEQIKEYLNPEDKLYFLGDAIDRGPHGYQIMKEILERPNTVYIKGNHEDMMYNALYELLHDHSWTDNKYQWFRNGGEPTYEEIKNLDIEELLSTIAAMPTKYTLEINGRIVYLTHAGFNPGSAILQYLEEDHPEQAENLYIWDRNHISTKKWRGSYNEFCIHGHTPLSFIINNENKMIETLNSGSLEECDNMCRYCEGHKIDLDFGAPFIGFTGLFNLETFELEKIFSAPVER